MNFLDDLNQVQKPGRYIGEEWNQVLKNWGLIDIKILISYPDIYEIGMSNQGLKVIYELLNSKNDVLCERCFAPWSDFEQYLRQRNQVLFSLESKTPINKFDVVAFTLQHELNYTNILTILDLGGLQIWQRDRDEDHPLVIGGGPCTLNPEPVADFFDFFIVGDAEEVIHDVLDVVKQWKQKRISRVRLLELVSGNESVYVPSLYQLKQTKEGFMVPEVERKIKKSTVIDLDSALHPVNPIVPYIQTVHDRINLEVMRGCPKFCRFCQARVYYGPFRSRTAKNLIQIAKENYKHTGYEEICLSSLSTGDYPYLSELLNGLKQSFCDQNVFISLPSLWVGKNIEDVLGGFLETKRPALTFAPEVTSLRMKDIIGKNVEEEQLVKVVKFALDNGWKQVKLYYMLGLPGMKDEDLIEMKRFLLHLLSLKTKRRIRLKLSFATFIPKPHTPFQWMDFESRENIENQLYFVKKQLGSYKVDWSIRKYDFSLTEAILSRGDRRLSCIIFEVWMKGGRFDSWEREFKSDLWYNAFESCGLNLDIYLKPKWCKDSVLPWEHIDAGISKDELWKSYSVAKNKI
ncbi:MAG: TIGR03960 family B12-binding radical SAM protein [Candidatus Saelkia tenebricola]|nr:TIGR03960 family B12-binding radical SAM protein [Candidatus Saelkia tenebricola]